MADSEDRSRPLPKDIRRLNDQITALEKQNTRLQAKSEAAALELARTKSALEMRDKDLNLMRKNFAKYGANRDCGAETGTGRGFERG